MLSLTPSLFNLQPLVLEQLFEHPMPLSPVAFEQMQLLEALAQVAEPAGTDSPSPSRPGLEFG